MTLRLAPIGLCLLWIAAAHPAPGQPTDAAPKEPTPPALEEPAKPVAIPLPEVASRAESAEGRLREVEGRAAPSAPIEKIAQALPNLANGMDERLEETRSALSDEPILSFDFLGDLENEWISREQVLAGWVDELTRRATELETELATLQETEDVWKKTLEAARESDAPVAVRERIETLLASIITTRKKVSERRDQVLTLQSTGSKQQARVTEILDQVRATRRVAVGELFAATDQPIWAPEFREDLASDLGEDFSDAVASQWQDVTEWAEERGSRFALHALLAVAIGLLLVPARRRLKAAQEAGPGLEHAGPVLDRPIAVALLLALLAAPSIYPQAPRAVLQLFYAAVLLPAVFMLRSLVAPQLHALLYAVVAFFFADRVRQILEPLHHLERAIFLVEMLAAIALLAWLARPARLAKIPAEAARSPVLRRVGTGTRVAFLALVVAVLAGAVGYARLARLLGDAVLGSAYAAVVLYAAVRITSVLIRFALRVDPMRRLNMVVRHRPLLARRADRVLRVAGTLGWAWATLDLLALGRPLLDGARGVLEAQLAIGAVTLSLGDLLAFVVTVWSAFLISRFLRFILEEDIFPRARMRRGMPYALSTLLHYAILLFGFLLAIGAAGVQLDRVAFMAGAFGVGLGFGLQNVVNNFVSGIILLFERPIQRGDMVQMNDLWGEVKRIGIRASVVRTFDGAEVIVPNGTLLSERLTNWTLSDRYRRLEVDVGVAYGTDPERVLEILLGVAAENPDVLSTPEPVALFQGFGDSALSFRLQAWATEFERGLRVKSALAVGINRALKDAGIEIPFPQRDLHLRSADEQVAGLLAPGPARPDAPPREE